MIFVEPANAACFAAGLAAGAPVRVATRFTLADGLAVAEAGRQTLAIARPLVHRLVQVQEGLGYWLQAQSSVELTTGADVFAVTRFPTSSDPKPVTRS